MSDFITLYTDASLKNGSSVLAWRGKCSEGSIDGHITTPADNIQWAEMMAIKLAIKDAMEKFPNVSGLFVNSDNLTCAQSFWTFRNAKIPGCIAELHKEIYEMIGEKWIRAKHVKAHTGKKDIRSYMNRTVDKMTKIGR